MDNIPVLSFVFLRGKCRFCQKPISLQYPMIELLTAFLFCLSSFAFIKNSAELVIASFIFVSFLVLFVFSDLKWKLLPHVFNNFFIVSGLIMVPWLYSNSGFFVAASDFIIIGSVLIIFVQFFPKGMGGGDVKMIAGLAVWMGLLKATIVFVFACVVASFVFFVLRAQGKVSWKWMIPFGPFLALGSFLAWFFPNYVNQLSFILIRMN